LDLQSLKIDRQAPAKARRRNPWPGVAVLGILAAVVWLFWTPLRTLVDRVNLPAIRAYLVTEASAASIAAVRGTAANGYVVAARRAALSSDVPGRIVELSVREGSIVKQGDIVARLYSDEYRAALERAAADLEVASASVDRAEAIIQERQSDADQATNAERTADARAAEARAGVSWASSEHERQKEMADKGIGSLRELDKARSDLDAARARQRTADSELTASHLATEAAKRRLGTARSDLGVAKARRQAAAATKRQAQATLDKTDVRAPFDGIVVLKDAEVGEVVSPNVQGGSNARGAVCTMVDFASLEVQAHVPESSLGSVVVGAPVDVFLDASPDEKLTGIVDRIWPTADRTKATVEVRILVEERERLRPEYGVRVVFRDQRGPESVDTTAEKEKRIVVPEAAVVEIDGVPTAFVLERDTVRATSVTIGERKGGRVTIETGLRAGQRIVADPPPSLRDKDRIRFADN